MIKAQVIGFSLLVVPNARIVLDVTGGWRLATIEPEVL